MATTRRRSSTAFKPPKDASERDTIRESRVSDGPPGTAERDDALREEMRVVRRELDAIRAELDALRTLVVHGRVSGAYRGESEG